MELKKFFNIEYQQNSYLIIKDNNAILIDPGFNGDKIIKYLTINKIKLQAIFITHGHFDHIYDTDKIYETFKVPIYLNQNDWCLIAKNTKDSKKIESPINDIEEGEIEIASIKIKCIVAPGHSSGSIVYLIDNYLFTGDVIFKNDTGRVDLYNSSPVKMKSTLRYIASIKENYQLYPGHYEMSSLDNERANIIKDANEI